MTTIENEKDDATNELNPHHTSLSIEENSQTCDGSLSSGLSMAEEDSNEKEQEQLTTTASALLLADGDRKMNHRQSSWISQNISNVLTPQTTTTTSTNTANSGKSALLTLFPSTQQNQNIDNATVTTVNRKEHKSNSYDDEVAYDDDDDDNNFGFSSGPVLERRMTEKRSNSRAVSRNTSANDLKLLDDIPTTATNTNTTTFSKDNNNFYSIETDYLLKGMDMDNNNGSGSGSGCGINDVVKEDYKKNYNYTNIVVTDAFQADDDNNDYNNNTKDEKGQTTFGNWCDDMMISWKYIKATISGSVTFILFHILFCLAQASAIHRPHSAKPILGQMTRMSALGPIVSGPLYV